MTWMATEGRGRGEGGGLAKCHDEKTGAHKKSPTIDYKSDEATVTTEVSGNGINPK